MAAQRQAPATRLPGRAVGARVAEVRQAPVDRRTGGPADPAYYWNGPARPQR